MPVIARALALAWSLALPGRDDVLGDVALHRVREGESLVELARAHDVGYAEIVLANRHLDPFVPDPGATVHLPTSWILPDAAPGTVVVNLSELRLYFVPRGHPERAVTFPIGVGREGLETPLGTFEVVGKEVAPAWHVPPSVKLERPGLPDVVPPGPDNPLGTHALRLSAPGILIHGTNRPWGVGRTVSHGCVRLYPEDIVRLFPLVPVGARVSIVRQPVKIGLRGDRVFAEVHADGRAADELFAAALRAIERRGAAERVDRAKLAAALARGDGLPVDVSR